MPNRTWILWSRYGFDTGTNPRSLCCPRDARFSGLHHLFKARACRSAFLPKGGITDRWMPWSYTLWSYASAKRSILWLTEVYHLHPSSAWKMQTYPPGKRRTSRLILMNIWTCPPCRNSWIVREYCLLRRCWNQTGWWAFHRWRKWIENPEWAHLPTGRNSTLARHKGKKWPSFL